MTVEQYDQQGGFKEEFGCMREMGMALTRLEPMIPARPHRRPELKALERLRHAFIDLQNEIIKTRDKEEAA